MNILVLGYSNIFRKRMLYALEKIHAITAIDIASFTAHEKVNITGKIRNVYTDYKEALSRSKSEIVYISTINSDHSKWIIEALNHGFHVIVDKPAVLNLEEAEQATELARNRGLFISEAIVYNYHPQIKAIKDLFALHNDTPKRITANFSVPGFADYNYRYDLEKGGGAIYDMAPYALTIGEVFYNTELNDIKAYKISGQNSFKDVETAFSVLIKFDSQKLVVGHFGFDTEYTNFCSILGDTLSVNFDRIFSNDADARNRISYKFKNQKQTLIVDSGDSFELYMLDCLLCIKEGNVKLHADKLLKQATLLAFLKKNIE